MTQNLGNLFIDFEDDVIEDETGNHTLASRAGVASSTDSVFGNASINATLNDSFIMNNGGTDFNLSNEPFTVDFWVKPLLAYDTWSGIVQLRPASSPIYDFSIAIHNVDKRIQFWSRDASTYVCLFKTPVNSITWEEWNHVAIVRYGNGANELKIFINGVEQTLAITVPLAYNASFPTFTTTMRFCTTPNVGSLIGRLDNFRWVKGEALWTENFSLTEGALFYYNPVLVPASSVYGIGHRGNLRGKAKAGFVRPTIKQLFTSKNYAETPKALTRIGYTDDIVPTWIDTGNFTQDNVILSANVSTLNVEEGGNRNVTQLFRDQTGGTDNLGSTGNIFPNPNPAPQVQIRFTDGTKSRKVHH